MHKPGTNAITQRRASSALAARGQHLSGECRLFSAVLITHYSLLMSTTEASKTLF